MISVTLLGVLKADAAGVKADAAAVKSDRAAVKVDEAAVKVESVRQVLKGESEKTEVRLEGLTKIAEDTKKTGEAVHVLVNSSMSAALKVSMVALRRLADNTKDEGDAAAALVAEDAYHTHERKQKVVDEMGAVK